MANASQEIRGIIPNLVINGDNPGTCKVMYKSLNYPNNKLI